MGNFLGVQWLEHCASTAGAWVPCLVREIRSCKPCSAAKKFNLLKIFKREIHVSYWKHGKIHKIIIQTEKNPITLRQLLDTLVCILSFCFLCEYIFFLLNFLNWDNIVFQLTIFAEYVRNIFSYLIKCSRLSVLTATLLSITWMLHNLFYQVPIVRFLVVFQYDYFK